jgi:hypothetical protein
LIELSKWQISYEITGHTSQELSILKKKIIESLENQGYIVTDWKGNFIKFHQDSRTINSTFRLYRLIDHGIFYFASFNDDSWEVKYKYAKSFVPDFLFLLAIISILVFTKELAFCFFILLGIVHFAIQVKCIKSENSNYFAYILNNP